MIGFLHRFTENIGLKSMSNIYIYMSWPGRAFDKCPGRAGRCQMPYPMIQSQLLNSSFKLIIFFTFDDQSSDLKQLDKFSEVLVEF